MKNLLLGMVAVGGMMLPLGGCESISQTANENDVRVRHAMLIDLKQITDDMDYILYIDRPVWLSRYPIPND